jgi:hypothetical protein
LVPSTPDSPIPARWEARLAALNPYAVALVMFCLSLAVAPLMYHCYDMQVGWQFWARATGGTRPWGMYLDESLPCRCNYPAFIPYLLTLGEKVRLLLHAPDYGPVEVILIKLPSVLAHLAGVPLCLLGLRRFLGERRARATAVLYALSAPLFVNAALWSQWDALLCLALVAALIALLHDRPVWAGAAMGWALTIKMQAIIAAPVLLVYVARRFGVKKLVAGMAAGLLVIGILSAPYVLAGAGKGIRYAYSGAVGHYTQRSLSAYNGWYLLDAWDVKIGGLPEELARSDQRPVLGPITSRQIGVTLFGAYTLFLLLALWRRPDGYSLILTAAMGTFAFFMLPTQMHDRFLAPAAVFLTLVAFQSPRAFALFLWLSVTSALNQLLSLYRHNATSLLVITPLSDAVSLAAAGLVAVANVALFVWATGVLRREIVAGTAPATRAAPSAVPSPTLWGRGA